MKKNIIIIIAAVIIAAGLGTGSFFGIRSARNPENVKNDVTTTEQNATSQNTDDENDTVTEGKPKTTAAKKSTQKGDGKLLTANNLDFVRLAHILDYARLTVSTGGDKPSFPEFDCTKEESYEREIPFKDHNNRSLYRYLFGEADFGIFYDEVDPLKELEKEKYKVEEEAPRWLFEKMNAENLRIISEEIFNLDFDKWLETFNGHKYDGLEKAYIYDGYCYYIYQAKTNNVDSRSTELVYSSDKQKSDGSYEVIFQARRIRRNISVENPIYYGDVKVECSLKDYNGMRLWSITKVGKA